LITPSFLAVSVTLLLSKLWLVPEPWAQLLCCPANFKALLLLIWKHLLLPYCIPLSISLCPLHLYTYTQLQQEVQYLYTLSSLWSIPKSEMTVVISFQIKLLVTYLVSNGSSSTCNPQDYMNSPYVFTSSYTRKKLVPTFNCLFVYFLLP
jgi:hypothetical protein